MQRTYASLLTSYPRATQTALSWAKEFCASCAFVVPQAASNNGASKMKRFIVDLPHPVLNLGYTLLRGCSIKPSVVQPSFILSVLCAMEAPYGDPHPASA